MADTYATVDANGIVTFTFNGVIFAQGLVFDEVDTTAVSPAEEIIWRDPAATSHIWQSIVGYSVIGSDPASLLDLAAHSYDVGNSAQVRAIAIPAVGAQRLAVILDSANRSNFYRLPAALPGTIAAGNAGDLLGSQGGGVNPQYDSPATLQLYKLPAAGSIAAGAAGDLLTSNGAGVNPSFQTLTVPAVTMPLWGDGSDGAAAFDGTNTFAFASTTGAAPNRVYTLTRDIYCTSLAVSAGKTVNTGGFRIFVAGTLTNQGTIQNVGGKAVTTTAGAGAPNGSAGGGGTAGGGGIVNGSTTVAGNAGANVAGSGATPVVGYHTLGGLGATGGNANGGAAGNGQTQAVVPGWRDFVSSELRWLAVPAGTAATAIAAAAVTAIGQGGTGGGGGGRTTGGTATVAGAGGGGGGIVHVTAKTIVNTGGVISANGGDGANATGGTCATGGGGGGGGGVVILRYVTLTAGAETATKGAAGSSINGGAAPGAAADGLVVKLAAA